MNTHVKWHVCFGFLDFTNRNMIKSFHALTLNASRPSDSASKRLSIVLSSLSKGSFKNKSQN